MNALPPAADLGGRDPSTDVAEIGQAVHVGLMGLQQRIGELQRSVETLAAEGRWVEPEPELTYAPPASLYAPAPAPAPQGFGSWAPPPTPPPSAPYRPQPAVGPPPPLAPAEWEQPFEPPPLWGAADPTPLSAAAGATPVAQLDAGPFADLIELRHFEETLAATPGVQDVRVRRFGHGRARIEVATGTTHELMAQIGRAYGPAQISERAGGEIVLELPLPADGEAGDDEDPEGEPAGEEG